MITQTVAPQRFPGVVVGVAQRDRADVGAVQTDRACDDLADPLRAARGIIVAMMLCTPFWIAVIWALR